MTTTTIKNKFKKIIKKKNLKFKKKNIPYPNIWSFPTIGNETLRLTTSLIWERERKRPGEPNLWSFPTIGNETLRLTTSLFWERDEVLTSMPPPLFPLYLVHSQLATTKRLIKGYWDLQARYALLLDMEPWKNWDLPESRVMEKHFTEMIMHGTQVSRF